MQIVTYLTRHSKFSFGLLAGFFMFSTLSYFRLIPWLGIKHKRKVVVFFGDSITQRGFEVESNGYVALMAEWWKRKVDILNRGYSGYNSRWGIKMMNDAVMNESPDLVAIFFGANDSVDNRVPQHVPLNEFSDNIEAMIRKVKLVSTLIPKT